MRINLQNKKTGSIVLEIAISAPVFLLLGAFILTAISCAKADILFSQAVDQVTQELSVAVPVAGGGIDLAGDTLSFINGCTSGSGDTPRDSSSALTAAEILSSSIGGAGAVLESLGIDGEDIFGTLLFGEGIRDRIVSTYYSYCSGERLMQSRISNASVYVDYDKENNTIWLHVYYQWRTLFGLSDRTIISAVPVYGDLEITLPVTDEDGKKEDKIWLLDNFERGYALRYAFGSNLPSNYPVIAIWDGGTATSIKSMDLTAPGYRSEAAVSDKICGEIDSLSEFTGTDYAWGKDKIVINEEQIHSRILIIVIPNNSPDTVYDELLSCSVYADAHGVQVRIEKYGNSYRYSDKGSSAKETE